MCCMKKQRQMNRLKLAAAFALACGLCLSAVSCVSSGQGSGPAQGGGQARVREPAYVIKAKRDNGFISAYQAFFAIDGDSISAISSSRYEDLTLGSDKPYERVSVTTCSFDIYAPGRDPMEWRYEQSQYDTKRYAVQSLIWDLKQMGLSYTGDVYVLVTFLDEYKIVKAVNLDGMVVLDESYAVFRNDEPLDLPKGMSLSDLSIFYKHR